MADITVNLDEPLFVPRIEKSLLDIVKTGCFHWPAGATCVTQEGDGELLWWSASVDEVRKARRDASFDTGLMSLVGLGQQVGSDYYEINAQEVVAEDWETAVVTLEQFTGLDA